ncbi:pyridoxal phosphate-dependent aminotransferase [Parasutterella secunda]|uniref:pyridoxal phosphate-dependent aminotransferase n=1 Tax=Parasutterella secunda TaxID=626947 RepID=UPI0025A3E306|nr:pyridoxal phosphate-dependent aminotransferase [Parasutterella secunda]MDM8113363.1 pyridoxal phosphate-dependent aminotransferase [Parasutterella secunda]MDM8218596.1 pyridoxal phosphate-dependent aminotransferase [Parasutterella secunda]
MEEYGSADFPMVRYVPYMGVIWTVNEASKLGFYNGHPDWCNVGQGQPEVGTIEGAPDRIESLKLQPSDAAYGPVGGTLEVREAIADWVNRTYRKGMSQYTAENVSFACGGRLALTRLYSIFKDGARIAYKNPDYTAYEDYLYPLRHNCELIELRAEEKDGFTVPVERFENFMHDVRPNAFVFSNPCNPTGQVIKDEAMDRYIEAARKENCLLGADEFYATFSYNEDGSPAEKAVSALPYVKDINRDPVIVFDGLTKGFRYPGWRAGWAIGPKYLIEMINRAASAVDGGPSTMVQRGVIEELAEGHAEAELLATRKEFAVKRKMMMKGLAELGIHTPANQPLGTFYLWASIENLPGKLSDADYFFHACLQKKVITVPGHFFDVRPFRVRPTNEPYRHWVRFSYGPNRQTIKTALERIAQVIKEHR